MMPCIPAYLRPERHSDSLAAVEGGEWDANRDQAQQHFVRQSRGSRPPADIRTNRTILSRALLKPQLAAPLTL